MATHRPLYRGGRRIGKSQRSSGARGSVTLSMDGYGCTVIVVGKTASLAVVYVSHPG